VGDGQALKIINNAMGEVNRLIYLEALQIAAARSIPEPLVHEVVSHGSGQSYSQVNISRFDNRPTSHAHLPATERPYRFSKDLRHALELGLAGRLSLPITALAAQLAPRAFEERWNAVGHGRAGLAAGAPEGVR
jgi:3-hydroxyisobutyrate dehydrogenase-like beta-hydroxyacid dehydrogenase